MVDDAVALHREIATKSEQLKALKANLVQQARLNPEALVATESGGKRWSATGSDGCIARVSFPAAALISEIESDGEVTKQIQAIVGNHFRRLFTTVKFYQLIDDFRAQVGALLPKRKAEALLKLCEAESAPRVSFETAKRVEPDATA